MSGSVSSSNWRRNQAAVTVATFIGFTGFTLVMPFLPLYLQELGEHDTAAIAIWSGVSLGVTPLITAVMAPVWARLAERAGRKLIIARSLFSFVVIMTLMAWVSHPWQVFALRAVQGLFAGYGALAMMVAAESAPPEHMAAAIGWVQTAQRLGPALGPVFGGVFAAAFGLRGAFYVSAIFFFIAFLFVLVGFREDSHAVRGARAAEPQVTFGALCLVPHFLLALATIFGLQMVDRSFGPVLPLYLVEIGTSVTRVSFLTGVIFTVAAGSAAVGNQSTAWLLRRVSARALVPACALVAAASAVVFGLGPDVIILSVAAVVFGFGIGVATTSVYTDIGQRLDVGARRIAFAYLQTAYLLGLAISPVIAGLIGARSMRAVFYVDAAGLAFLAWAVWKQSGPAEARA
jgi:DHA1 family multidrug resistance protein-like MFS transporter